MTRRSPALALSFALAAFAPAAFAADGNIEKVNGSITVDASERAGSLETVNGSINIGADATTGSAQTVNGSIRASTNVRVGGLETVNGSIRVERQGQIGGDVETVNGSIYIGRGGTVRGDVETVNGAIGIVDTDLSGGIATVNGDVTVGAGSHVRGGLRIDKPGKQWLTKNKPRVPRVIIGPDARVDGALVFEREVRLYVHTTAKTGPVTGATAIAFSSPTPPSE